MIAHVSIPAHRPLEIAQFLSRLIDGKVFSFPVVEGAYIAIADDGSGLSIEVYPLGTSHHPGQGEVDPSVRPTGPQTMPWEDQIFRDAADPGFTGHHMALKTRMSEGQVLAMAREAGFRALSCERGGVFRVIEVWIENRYLIEVMTESELARYRAFMNPRAAAEMFGPPLAR
jgi:hypothetical protein